jgi:putative hydrolase of the HAD superfamily
MPKIQRVFLDMGNVLVFHDDHVLCQRLSQCGGDPPDVILQRLRKLWEPFNRGTLAGDDLRGAVCQAAGLSTVLDWDTFTPAWTCHFTPHHEVFPLVRDLLRQVPVSLVSNVNQVHWTAARPMAPVIEEFADLVLSYDVHLVKPELELFHTAVRRAGCPAETCAFFDDVPDFVNAASSVGIHGRVFTTAANFRAQLAELGIVV